MRTTLSIDEDVLLAVKEQARREGRTAGEVLSELARHSLMSRGAQHAAGGADTFHGFEPLPHRGGAVSNAFIDRLRDDDAV